MLTFCQIQMHISSQQEVWVFIFIFQKVVFLWPPSYKWHHKKTKSMFHIKKFTSSDRINPIECVILELKVFCGTDTLYGRSKFWQNDTEKNLAPCFNTWHGYKRRRITSKKKYIILERNNLFLDQSFKIWERCVNTENEIYQWRPRHISINFWDIFQWVVSMVLKIWCQ